MEACESSEHLHSSLLVGLWRAGRSGRPTSRDHDSAIELHGLRLTRCQTLCTRGCGHGSSMRHANTQYLRANTSMHASCTCCMRHTTPSSASLVAQLFQKPEDISLLECMQEFAEKINPDLVVIASKSLCESHALMQACVRTCFLCPHTMFTSWCSPFSSPDPQARSTAPATAVSGPTRQAPRWQCPRSSPKLLR
jgi:hypothetical protein